MLRERGVVGQLRRVLRPRARAPAARRPRDDRQHVAGVRLDLRDLPDRRRDAALPRVLAAARPSSIALVEAYAREQGLFHDEHSEQPTYSDVLELDLGEVVPSLAGPKRPQDRVPLTERAGVLPRGARRARARAQRPRRGDRRELPGLRPAGRRRSGPRAPHRRRARGRLGSPHARRRRLARGGRRRRSRTARASSSTTAHVVIAAITRCTNTSNPSVMLAAGLLAATRWSAGCSAKPWVKTSLAPGSKVVTDYYDARRADRAARGARLQPRRLRLHDLHRQLRAAAAPRSPAAVDAGRPRGRARCCRATATSRGASTRTCR